MTDEFIREHSKLRSRTQELEQENARLRAQVEAALRATGPEARDARARLERALEILSPGGGAGRRDG